MKKKKTKSYNEWKSIKENPPKKCGDYLFLGCEAISNNNNLQRVKYWDGKEVMPKNYAPSVTFEYWMELPKPIRRDYE